MANSNITLFAMSETSTHSNGAATTSHPNLQSQNISDAFASKFLMEALTYDDVLLVPAYSETLPRNSQTKTWLTKTIALNVPIVSAAMDTVSEAEMAIAIAQEGGMAFIHKNMSIARQAEQVRKVKRSESGMITDPVTVFPNQTLADANRLMKEFKIGGIPVVDETQKLVGILTNRDLRFQKNLSLPVSDIMTAKNLITAKEGVDLAQAEDIFRRK